MADPVSSSRAPEDPEVGRALDGFSMPGCIGELAEALLGLGVPPGTPSLGELLNQGKENLDAWWIIVPTFATLTLMLLLLTFIGEALRDAFDTRKS